MLKLSNSMKKPKEGELFMKKEVEMECLEGKDLIHHYLEEQIAFISVMEEEERMREEIEKNGNNSI